TRSWRWSRWRRCSTSRCARPRPRWTSSLRRSCAISCSRYVHAGSRPRRRPCRDQLALGDSVDGLRTPHSVLVPAMTDHIIPPLGVRGGLALDAPELIAWGEQLGRSASPPLVIAITGELGAGKTTLVQAICRGYGVKNDVTSPTFALVHRYAGKLSPVYHLDLYRLEKPEDLTNLAWDEIVGDEALVLLQGPD